ncbi:hypothetical protein ACIQPP_49130 [Streptomyces violaceusniger]|uniref:hypothetical protein n=1 Tax=Streptomyces violaceusniger TaxID=68280 RepID=UPI001F1E44A4|nr:hypothetical protein [Streptomyces hygroscopicus]
MPVEVLLDGELVFPWVTWFIDTATEVIPGAAITPYQPSMDAILAALRIALSRDEDPTGPHGPIGGLPSLVRIDRGADFLSTTVADALGHFAVPVQDLRLPARFEGVDREPEPVRRADAFRVPAPLHPCPFDAAASWCS